MEFLDGEIKNFADLEKAVIKDLETDDYWIDGEDGSLPTIENVDDIHDLFERFVEEEDYEEFCKILEEGRESFTGIEIDTEGPYDAAMAFWLSNRGC